MASGSAVPPSSDAAGTVPLLAAEGASAPAAPVLPATELSEVKTEEAVAGAVVAAPPRVLVPSLRGTMVKEGNTVVCRGMWAMTDEQHRKPDLTSEFEFRLVSAADQAALSSGAFPIAGNYQGWFKLRKAPPLKGHDKIDDKGITINFEAVTPDEREKELHTNNGGGAAGENGSSNGELFNKDADMRVLGKGQNRFGTFTLKGWLDSKTGSIIMYRQYVPKPVKIRVKSEGKSKMSSDGVVTPREGAGRMRKQSSLVKDFDVGAQPPAKVAKTGGMSKEATKAQKLNLQLQKCTALLEEMSKHPKATFFLEPVDPIKLNIPDYALLITRPMDMTTVRNNLISNVYKSPSEYADHMRLIFKNAIAYNSLRDNPVHIAAREMAKTFEEKYRAIVQAAVSSSVPAKNKKQRYPGAAMMPMAGYPHIMPAAPPKRTKGPHPAAVGLPPDGSMVQMQEMQRKMMEMQNELLTLRTVVAQEQVKDDLDQRQADSQNPLTLEEKQELINTINTLPPTDMERIITIIQEASPQGQEAEEDIEIPLDELDTHTLRKLQAYVRSVTGAKQPYVNPSAPAGGSEAIGLGFDF